MLTCWLILCAQVFLPVESHVQSGMLSCLHVLLPSRGFIPKLSQNPCISICFQQPTATNLAAVVYLHVDDYDTLWMFYLLTYLEIASCLQCFDAVGWVAGRASSPKNMGGWWRWALVIVQMEWRPAGWSVCLPLLISRCTIKSRSSSSGTSSPGWSRKKGRKTVVVVT